MPTRPKSVRSNEAPCSTGSNSGRSPSFNLLMMSRARSGERTSWTWLATASWLTVALGSLVFSASGRRKMLSRVSISTRDSDLYFGVIRLTAMKAAAAAASVTAMIETFRRHSARPSAPRSNSSTAACMTPSRVVNCALAPITDLVLTRTTRDSRSYVSISSHYG